MAAQPSEAGRGGSSAQGPRAANNSVVGRLAGSASARQRPASADPGRAPKAAVRGTGPQARPARQSRAGSRHATPPGQADIPGLPYPAAAPTARQARIGPRVRPAHSSPSAGRAAAEPATPARPAGGHDGYWPLGPARAAYTAAGQAASAVGRRGSGRVRQAATLGAATIPGLPDQGLWQVAGTPSPPARHERGGKPGRRGHTRPPAGGCAFPGPCGARPRHRAAGGHVDPRTARHRPASASRFRRAAAGPGRPWGTARNQPRADRGPPHPVGRRAAGRARPWLHAGSPSSRSHGSACFRA